MGERRGLVRPDGVLHSVGPEIETAPEGWDIIDLPEQWPNEVRWQESTRTFEPIA